MCADSYVRKSCPALELYIILDESLLRERDARLVLEEVIQGGADVVQYRAKLLTKRRYYENAASLLPIARHNHVPFFVNDHLDIALAFSADGIHLGQNDLPCSAARPLMPEHMLLGVSTHSIDEAEKAADDGADYVAIGSVFPTTTKENPEAIIGLDTVRAVKQRLGGSIPLIAIGGIHLGNVAKVIEAGADAVAVASGVMLADDPRLAARELKEKIRAAKAA